jgi:hypothetical protein
MGMFPKMELDLTDPPVEVAADATPLDFLFAVYRSAEQPMVRRLKAACEAAQYVHPTYKATAMIIGGDSLAKRLEAAIERSGVGPKVIEHKPEPVELAPSGPEPTPLNAPFPKLERRRC